jgi:hypothetical protein
MEAVQPLVIKSSYSIGSVQPFLKKSSYLVGSRITIFNASFWICTRTLSSLIAEVKTTLSKMKRGSVASVLRRNCLKKGIKFR